MNGKKFKSIGGRPYSLRAIASQLDKSDEPPKTWRYKVVPQKHCYKSESNQPHKVKFFYLKTNEHGERERHFSSNFEDFKESQRDTGSQCESIIGFSAIIVVSIFVKTLFSHGKNQQNNNDNKNIKAKEPSLVFINLAKSIIFAGGVRDLLRLFNRWAHEATTEEEYIKAVGAPDPSNPIDSFHKFPGAYNANAWSSLSGTLLYLYLSKNKEEKQSR